MMSPPQSPVTAAVANLQPVLISAPFGNYVQPQGCTPTLGTFTLEARPGRLWRILKTVRYYHRLRAWVNQIGLRNPGLPWLAEQVRRGRRDLSKAIVSIHGFDDQQWYRLLEDLAALEPMAIELNMSCPNVGHVNWPTDLFRRAHATGLPVIVKLPPVRYEVMARQALDGGLGMFHCCNTLPVPAGGLSGQPLKPVALMCLMAMRAMDTDRRLCLIGGGGIYQPADVDDYVQAGADHVAIGTKAMNPLLLLTHRPLQPLIRHAHAVLGRSPQGEQ